MSDGDGDVALVVTAFTAPSGLRASTRSRCRSRRSQEILIEADGGTVVSGLWEPDGGGDARGARNFRGTPLLYFFVGLKGLGGWGIRVQESLGFGFKVYDLGFMV